MRIPIVLVMVATVAACAGDAPPPTGRCVGALFQPCNEEHDCASNVCQNFAAEGFQVCSQLCDAQNPCPADSTCDDVLATCKPAEPDGCTP